MLSADDASPASFSKAARCASAHYILSH